MAYETWAFEVVLMLTAQCWCFDIYLWPIIFFFFGLLLCIARKFRLKLDHVRCYWKYQPPYFFCGCIVSDIYMEYCLCMGHFKPLLPWTQICYSSHHIFLVICGVFLVLLFDPAFWFLDIFLVCICNGEEWAHKFWCCLLEMCSFLFWK